MINWWFWWHPQAGERFGIGFSKKQKDYFAGAVCPEFQPNTHFPLEKIGKVVLPLRVDFVNAEQLGFSLDLMTEKEIPVIVAGHVGAFGGIVMHTEMAHIFKRTDDGLVLISRFWLGKTMKSKLLKKLIITEKMAEDMARHCCVEYRNLVEILPALYGEYGK